MKTHKVIIIDDESIMREGLESWLSNEYETLSFDSAETFLEAFNHFAFEDGKPTCILLDFQLPGMNGIKLQDTLKSINSEFPIIFMSGNAEQKHLIEAWRGGAVDFILNPFSSQDINEILKTQFSRQKPRSPISQPQEQSTTIVNLPITKREAEVLILLAQGHQQVEVAQILDLSLRTVKMYRTFLKNKLGLNTLIELARYYDEHKPSIHAITNHASIKKLVNRY